jgi:hypothetical protein
MPSCGWLNIPSIHWVLVFVTSSHVVELSGVCPVDKAAQFASSSGSFVPVLLSIDLLSLDRGSPYVLRIL